MALGAGTQCGKVGAWLDPQAATHASGVLRTTSQSLGPGVGQEEQPGQLCGLAVEQPFLPVESAPEQVVPRQRLSVAAAVSTEISSITD